MKSKTLNLVEKDWGIWPLHLLFSLFSRHFIHSPLSQRQCPFLRDAISFSFESESRSVVSDSSRPHGPYSPWNSPGQNTGEGSYSLLQGIFPTQGSNSGLLHYRWILYQLRHKGSWRILEWVAYPFSWGSSQPRNQTGVFCIACRFFTNWYIRETQ